jgi:interferon gamma-inducible protein 30
VYILGARECEGNIIHCCAIESIHDTEMRLNFVACMIRDNSNPQEAFHRCSREFAIDVGTVETIQKCYSSLHGKELLKIAGEATHALNPTVSFIPTITLDGQQRRQATILRDLFAEICAVLSESGLTPKICEAV